MNEYINMTFVNCNTYFLLKYALFKGDGLYFFRQFYIHFTSNYLFTVPFVCLSGYFQVQVTLLVPVGKLGFDSVVIITEKWILPALCLSDIYGLEMVCTEHVGRRIAQDHQRPWKPWLTLICNLNINLSCLICQICLSQLQSV